MGDYTAVGSIEVLPRPSTVPPTVYDGALLVDGDPDSAFYAGNQGVPIPEAIPFPSFPFAKKKDQAIANGTYFASGRDFLAYLERHTVYYDADGIDNNRDGLVDEPGERAYYEMPVPTTYDDNHVVVLENASGTEVGIVSKTEVSRTFYIDGGMDLSGAPDTLLVLRDVSLVVNGRVSIARPTEFYAPYDQVAIATPDKIGITDKDHSDGQGGPVHLEGVLYSMGQVHIHQTDPYNAVYFAGVEIADYIHNCEWFRHEYKLYDIPDLTESIGSDGELRVTSWHEVYE